MFPEERSVLGEPTVRQFGMILADVEVPGTRWTRLTMRWCQSGGVGHRITTRFRAAHSGEAWHYTRATSRTMRSRCAAWSVEHRHAHRTGQVLTVFADVRDATTGMRYWSTYPVRVRIR